MPALLLSVVLTPLFTPSSAVSLFYFVLAVPMCECLGKHSCMSSSFPIAILNGACIVPLYKGKGDKCECSNSRGFSLLSAVGKLDRKSTRLNSSHSAKSRMPSSA